MHSIHVALRIRAVGSALLFVVCMTLVGCDRSKQSSAPGAAQGESSEPSANSQKRSDKLEPVTLQLNWHPEVEHGGFYAAQVQGFYGDAGLDVKILGGGPETPVVQQVATDRVTFGIVNADNILFGRVQEAPLVAVMAPLQTSPRCLIAQKASGIASFDDLKNVTIAMSSTQAFSHYLRHKVQLDGATIVPYQGTVSQLLQNPRLVQQGYVFSEPFVARQQGVEVNVLMLSDLGFNPYTSVLVATEKRIADQPELVQRMVTASIQGWRHYLKSPQQANEEIHRQNPRMPLDILEFGAEAIQPLVETADAKAQGVGTMTLERWQSLTDQLEEIKMVKPEQIDAAKAFDNRFAEAVSK